MSIPSKISAKTNPNRIDGIARIGGFMYPLFTTNLKKLTVAFQNEPFSYFVSLQSPCSSSPCQHEATCVTNYRDGSFGCRCAKGFIGEYCEKGE